MRRIGRSWFGFSKPASARKEFTNLGRIQHTPSTTRKTTTNTNKERARERMRKFRERAAQTSTTRNVNQGRIQAYLTDHQKLHMRTKRMINRLKEHRAAFTIQHRYKQHLKRCVICKDPLHTKPTVCVKCHKINPCIFHRDCLFKWIIPENKQLSLRTTCPWCRNPLKLSDKDDLDKLNAKIYKRNDPAGLLRKYLLRKPNNLGNVQPSLNDINQYLKALKNTSRKNRRHFEAGKKAASMVLAKQGHKKYSFEYQTRNSNKRKNIALWTTKDPNKYFVEFVYLHPNGTESVYKNRNPLSFQNLPKVYTNRFTNANVKHFVRIHGHQNPTMINLFTLKTLFSRH